MIWTDEAVTQLAEYNSKGFTAREISAKLGCTRNAVIGKLHRAKIKDGYKPKESSLDLLKSKWAYKWTESQVTSLKNQWANKRPVTQIAKNLGVSVPTLKWAAEKLGLEKYKPDRSVIKYYKVAPTPPKLHTPKPMAVLQDIAPAKLMERTGCCCPVGKATGEHQLFCNAAVDGGSYCEAHKKVLFNASYHPRSVRRLVVA